MGGLERLRLHSADSTLSHLWPTGSRVRVAPFHYGLVLLLKPFRLRLAADALPSDVIVSPRGITPEFGYESPSPRLSGTLTHLMIVLPRTHYEWIRLPNRH